MCKTKIRFRVLILEFKFSLYGFFCLLILTVRFFTYLLKFKIYVAYNIYILIIYFLINYNIEIIAIFF